MSRWRAFVDHFVENWHEAFAVALVLMVERYWTAAGLPSALKLIVVAASAAYH